MKWHPISDDLAAGSSSPKSGANSFGGLDSGAKASMLSEAIQLSNKGFSIIPVGRDKRPLVKWERYQKERADEEQIQHWFEQYPQMNIGVVTGAISGIVVIDVESGGSTKEFPPTVISRTGGGGWHLYYRHPGVAIKNSVKDIAPLTDVRGDGCYVVLPPSVHASGNNYEWAMSPNVADFADLPPHILEKIKAPKGKIDWKELSTTKVPEGRRNNTAAQFIGKLLHRLPPELWETVWPAVKEWNQKNCNPSLDEKELRSVFESIGKRQLDGREKGNKRSKALVTCLADIQPEPISWLWPERIALGKLTMIVGDPNLGKSLITAALAAAVSKKYPWPLSDSLSPEGDVVLLSAEDDPADTIRPRLDAAMADCSRIHILKAVQDSDKEGTQRGFSIRRDIPVLEDILCTLPNCKLLIVDPISAYLDGTDSNNNSDIRGLLAPLADLAARYKIAIVLIQHLNKSIGGSAMYRSMGSLAFIAAARSAYLVTKDKNDKDRRLFMPIKNNLAKERSGLAYRVGTAENGYPVIQCELEAVTTTADEALAVPESNGERTATDEAVDFLLILLSAGPMPKAEIEKEAQGAGISAKPLRLARTKLGINTTKSGFAGGWVWALPQHQDALNSEEALTSTEGTLDEKGTLADEKF